MVLTLPGNISLQMGLSMHIILFKKTIKYANKKYDVKQIYIKNT